jgi:hypothetical protein
VDKGEFLTDVTQPPAIARVGRNKQSALRRMNPHPAGYACG